MHAINAHATKTNTRSVNWLIPTGLILLSIVPIAAGAFRITDLAGGGNVTPDNARFFASPLPVVIHIVGASLYALLGAFQFAPGVRRRWPAWHRTAGKVLVPCGLAAALSGLWMTHFYPWPSLDGELLYGMRLVFGAAMTLALVLAVRAVRRRDFTRHGEWMIRAYAIGLGAGTQLFTHIPMFVFPSAQSELTRALCMGAGWVINLAVAEWVIRTRLGRRTRRAPS